MSKRKGLSAEEKKSKMLQIFYQKKDVFQLKELEKIAPKEQGIIVNSVKDVLQSLVDDGLVDTDKIGSSLYYWAFPSKTLHNKKLKRDELNKKNEEYLSKLKSTTESLKKFEGKEDQTFEKNQLLDEIVDLEKQREELLKELQHYKDNDPEILKDLKNKAAQLKEATNRWTDNVFQIKSWSKRKFNIEEQALDKQFGIPNEFDYIE